MNCAIGNKDVSVRFLSFFIGAAHSFLYCFAKGRNIYEASGVLSSFFVANTAIICMNRVVAVPIVIIG